ncbi:MAG: HEPN domain-containing protein [Parcubacteria group bacterium]|jgi:uncharacterized protein (UPF0332 family)
MKIFQELIDNGLIKEEKIDFALIKKVLVKSHRGIKSAQLLLEDGDCEGSYELAYESMLLAGRALVFSFDFRPRAAGSHKIVIDFVKQIMVGENSKLVFKFNKMRKNRHYLIYGAGLAISQTEAKNAISSATILLEKIEKMIEKNNPQRKLEL